MLNFIHDITATTLLSSGYRCNFGDKKSSRVSDCFTKNARGSDEHSRNLIEYSEHSHKMQVVCVKITYHRSRLFLLSDSTVMPPVDEIDCSTHACYAHQECLQYFLYEYRRERSPVGHLYPHSYDSLCGEYSPLLE